MEMLSSSFFMKNSIGEAIKEEISSIVDLYNKAVRDVKDVKADYVAKGVRMRYVCDNIGDEFLKQMVDRMVKEIAETVKHK